MSGPRAPRLRRRLSLTLVGVSLVSVLLLSVVNFVFARLLIDESVEEQLASVRDTRIEALENGFGRIESQVSTLAATPSVVAALEELTEEFAQLDDDITPEQIDGLAAVYDDEFLPPFEQAGAVIDARELVPGSPAGRYVQHHYVAENPNDFDERGRLDDAGDGSGYSAAHARHHPVLRELMENAGATDLLLVEGDAANVVYSVSKRIELGTNGLTWPGLSDEFSNVRGIERALTQLSTVAVGESILSDMVFYIPTRGDPVLFVAAAVRSGSDVLGAIVTLVPVDALTTSMTAGENWQLLGLGDTGEAFLVGPDGLLRSESRAWIEDPDDFLRRTVDHDGDANLAQLIETVGSPVLLQNVDNDAVATALDNEEFVGKVTSYLGEDVLSVSAPANLRGLNWAVVVEQDTAESNEALNSLLRAVLIVLAILLPTIALVGWLLARTLTRPAQRLVEAAASIADGNLDTEIEDLGRNELGDLGRQLEGVARQLEAREQAIVDEEQHIIDLLSAALPSRLVDRVRHGEQSIEDIFDSATAVALTIDGIPDAAGADHDLALEINERLNDGANELLERFGLERVQRSSGNQLFLAGLAQDDARADDAARFAWEAAQLGSEIGTEFGMTFTVRAGMASGEVATGVLGTDRVSFGVWGDPPGLAVTLAALARPGQVLADASVAEQLGRDWDLGPLDELPGLADDIDVHVVNGPMGARSAPE
ncbi:HAMP domain-containing protein [Ilumatobacter sp.]|uniref:HAMP domain-containing protein n=1 Tax=Ilumatobacter sp. TaxID=1967498 RepID=UPI003AF54573